MRSRTPLAAFLVLAGCVQQGSPTGARRGEIINGTPTPDGLYEATGALMVDGQFGCTGTLISPTVVVTAAHCLDEQFIGSEPPGFTLALDANEVIPGEIVPGESSHPHPDFELFSEPEPGVGQWYDIGVLILAEPIEGVAYEQLPTPAEAEEYLVTDATVDIVGYGITDPDEFEAGVKHHGTATLVEVGDAELFIAEPGEQQNCNGDSGGPALLEVAGGERRLVGVVSRAPDDDPTCDHGGIDTRVDTYLDFIDSVIDEDLEPPDAGPPDAAPPVEPDAAPPSAGADAGVGSDPGARAGCGCGAGGGGEGVSILLLAAAVLFLRRRMPA